MKKKKTVKILLVAIAMALILTGCVDAHMHVTINLDGSGTYEVKILSNKMIASQFDDLKQRLAQYGYQVKELDEGNKKGWVATKIVDNVVEEPPGKEFQDGANAALEFFSKRTASANTTDLQYATPSISGLGKEFKVENSLFTTTLIFDTNVDLTDLNEGSDTLGSLNQMILDQINLNFILTLPVEVDKHNATSVSDDGKTLTWKIKPGEKNPIYMAIDIPNFLTWGIIIVLGIIVLIIVIIVLVSRRKKKKRSDDDNRFPPGSGDSHQPTTAFTSPSNHSDSSSSPDSFRWD
ncbi:DUF3153 domain-containing protein [Paenactinomyces guangxiensis]|uniref:DUF3153 domain-containing protein n=1 Tax=Paenactinomyces guangxiensis TaxID=1490290 RepID=A0A7W2A8I3_9BACL|nr:DUF3153 domain-containing protein [Paenactinomyces guangxiensis]MBA4494209.1 DUF3153 domain-containing protein [Paenactinomyces guangxiensis]MBH8590705.1 DUF3153 domain-containing protein [Paenactinomyces guangxiensis]